MNRVLSLLVGIGIGVSGLAVVTGCGTDPVPSFGAGLGTPEDPIPQAGTMYAVRSLIAPSAGVALPAEVTDVSASMRAFSSAPARTMLSIASTNSVAEYAQLTSALSATLSSKLEGYLDAEIAKATVGGKTVKAFASDIAGYAETALTQFGLDSTLSFSPEKTKHSLDALTFRLAGFEIVVPLGGLTQDALEQQPVVTVAAAGAITFGDHKFGLAFGSHAWQGINLASSSVYASDVRTALTTGLDCHAVAVAVAAKCSSTSSCVGHQALLEAICDQSLDILVTDLDTAVVGFDFSQLHITSGSAKLVDDDLDGYANRIETGVWTPVVAVGTASATFTAMAGTN
ncbi:hypothetical protein BH11MYX1_BH11MYX1_52800 [soil metagenome]